MQVITSWIQPGTFRAGVLTAAVFLAACAQLPSGRTQASAPPAPHGLSITMPVAALCADPRGRAILDQDLPGLVNNPNFEMFKSMSLPEIQKLSGGRLSLDKVQKVREDLAAASGRAP